MSKLDPRLSALGMLVALACTMETSTLPSEQVDPIDDGFDDRPVERAAEPPPPITGGTLLVTKDQAFAVASDPDRDVVHVVDLAQNVETATIELPGGARPFRGAEDAAGLVHVTLRGTGEVVAVDPYAGQLVSTTRACPNPRGIAYHEGRDAILVACAGGQLVEIAAAGGDVLDRRFIATDLRDVFVNAGATYVSRFRTAEVLRVLDPADVDPVQVEQTIPDGAPVSPNISGVLRMPSTAWRTVSTGDGWLMLHQLASTQPLDAPPPGGEVEEFGSSGGFFPGGEGGYTGGGIPCGGATNPALSTKTPDGEIFTGNAMMGVALAVDVALSGDGTTIAVASPSQHEGFRGDTLPISLMRFDLLTFPGRGADECTFPETTLAVDDFVAVAYTHDGTLLAQTRADPQLYRFAGDGEPIVIDLAGEEIVDTGHDLFHLDTGSGIACASCHPEGGDDGRVWAFRDQGPRRTQALDAGLAGTEPFHWGGDMVDLPMLANEVRGRRMGGAAQSEERIAALQEWLFAIPQPNHERTGSDPMAARGAALFTELGCRTCHSGPAFTSNGVHDFGRGLLQIPNLRGVALRPPYMHDGRCDTLTCATQEMVEVTRGPGELERIGLEGLTALVAYLETI
jgi:hypothetical protein